jgi:lipoprotein-anchoring transpeptidase ErfK/SrfK
MPERTTILSIVLAAAVAAALATLPVSVKAQGEYSDPAGQSGKSGAKSDAKAKKSSSESKAPEVKKKEPTKGQLEARERQKKCGAEWRDAKAKGTLEKGITWPKYWSACNKRLKGQA